MTSLTSFNVIMIKSLIEIHRIHILLIMMFLHVSGSIAALAEGFSTELASMRSQPQVNITDVH